MILFETKRLYVRELVMEDWPAFHQMQSNPRVMRYTGTAPMTEAESRKDLQAVIQAYSQENNTFWVWAALRKEDHAMAGTCALVQNEEGEQEIGYRLLETYWGNGYGLEMTRGLVAYALNELQLPVLVAYVDTRNLPSIRILEGSGFRLLREFYNQAEGCTDRLYRVTRSSGLD
ncbi:MAG: N-acetyltransferase [Bacteroidetes bacterium]|nr:MAG: N-acetyltransferase [Bacteroidota bacterium]